MRCRPYYGRAFKHIGISSDIEVLLQMQFARRGDVAEIFTVNLSKIAKLAQEPLIVLMPADHRLSARSSIRPGDLAAERLIGVPMERSPVLRTVTDAYAKAIGVDLSPEFEVDNLSMAMSLVVSTGGIALMPLYAKNLLPPTMTSRTLEGIAPTIELSVVYSTSNASSALAAIVRGVCGLAAGQS